MKRTVLVAAACIAGHGLFIPQAAFSQTEETLRYAINRPSGLPVGEARLETKRLTQERWEFLFSMDAAVPGAEVADRFRSTATPGYCSVEFERDSRHGKRVVREKTAFDQAAGSALRQTLGGGSSKLEIPACARDVLTFLHYLRRELAGGRVPPPQTVFFGGPYQIKLEYGGRHQITAGEETIQADLMKVTVKGPSSGLSLEVFLAQDQLRRPVLIRAALPSGVFAMELIP